MRKGRSFFVVSQWALFPQNVSAGKIKRPGQPLLSNYAKSRSQRKVMLGFTVNILFINSLEGNLSLKSPKIKENSVIISELHGRDQ